MFDDLRKLYVQQAVGDKNDVQENKVTNAHTWCNTEMLTKH